MIIYILIKNVMNASAYNELLVFLENSANTSHQYRLSIKNIYFVIMIPNANYHISIFQDQWDNYETITDNPYYLFHISSDNEINRCSSYFWVRKSDLKIKKIPLKYFKYNQPEYNFNSSTRNQCNHQEIKPILSFFQKILDKLYNEYIKKN